MGARVFITTAMRRQLSHPQRDDEYAEEELRGAGALGRDSRLLRAREVQKAFGI